MVIIQFYPFCFLRPGSVEPIKTAYCRQLRPSSLSTSHIASPSRRCICYTDPNDFIFERHSFPLYVYCSVYSSTYNHLESSPPYIRTYIYIFKSLLLLLLGRIPSLSNHIQVHMEIDFHTLDGTKQFTP